MYFCVCNPDTNRRFITFSLIVKYDSSFIEGLTEIMVLSTNRNVYNDVIANQLNFL